MTQTEHTLLGSRDYWKPLAYPWAFDGYLAMQKMHWLPDEIPLHEDVSDWNDRLTEGEKSLLTQLFRFFTQADVDVASGYRGRYQPAFGGHPEVAMMLSAFATSEANHVHSYSLLLDTIGIPEAEYKAFQNYKEMRDKHEYMFGKHNDDLDEKQALALDMAIFSAFGEGMQLFSSFAMLLNFQRRGLMKGMGTVVEWSIKDESHHVEFMVKLFHQFIRENPYIWTDAFKARIYQAARDMVSLEDRFIELAFEAGENEGITVSEVKEYVRFIADRRLNQLGLKSNYGVEKNPFPWLEEILALRVHANFFEGRATEYRKGGVEGWEDVWASGGSVPTNSEVTVYTIPGCPFCSLVKHDLDTQGVTYTTVLLDEKEDREAFKLAHLVSTFPQVFDGRKRIGGSEETARWLAGAHVEVG